MACEVEYLMLFAGLQSGLFTVILSSGIRAVCHVVFPTYGLYLVLHSPLMKAESSRVSLLKPFYI